ncbi:MAG: AI-2E family transporter [Armatimonadetes bacterium]|nr:AI-2E family transporter [Armatimonadota bacterium]
MEHSEPDQREQVIYRALVRGIYLFFGLLLLLWFLKDIAFALMFLLTAIVAAMALNLPVTWLESRGVPRVMGTLIASTAIMLAFGAIFWAVLPPLLADVQALAEDLPVYLERAHTTLLRALSRFPALQERVQAEPGGLGEAVFSTLAPLLLRLGASTLTLFGLVVLALLMASTIIFIVARPRPILQTYLEVLPPHLRDAGEAAFIRAAEVSSRWVWSTMLLGMFKAVVSVLMLWYLQVPGATLWGVFTFFAELIPKFGKFLMPIPPAIVAATISPTKAFWVLVAYFVMNEFATLILKPLVRSSVMELHPASLIIAVVAGAAAFGPLGAFIATPVAGIIKAYYEEFFIRRRPPDESIPRRIDHILESGLGIAPKPENSSDPPRR